VFRSSRYFRPLIAATAAAAIFALAGCADSGSTPAAGSGDGASSTSPTAVAEPTISALSVSAGSVTGATEVVVTGSDLSEVTTVMFGANAATVTATTDDTITVIAPAATNFVAGSVEVTATIGDAAAASSTPYEYQVLSPLDAQMTYVLAHWSERNTSEYGTLVDNDCVNFTSQSLIERGWTMDDAWWHSQSGGVDEYSSAWISSTSMMKYFAARPALATALSDDQRDSVVVGDIVQFDWDNSGDRDHTGIVTRVEGTGAERQIFFAGHSLDSDYRSVDVAITTDHPGGTAYYWHLDA
jgi:Putative amidase domain/IPT/TIG domain